MTLKDGAFEIFCGCKFLGLSIGIWWCCQFQGRTEKGSCDCWRVNRTAEMSHKKLKKMFISKRLATLRLQYSRIQYSVFHYFNNHPAPHRFGLVGRCRPGHLPWLSLLLVSAFQQTKEIQQPSFNAGQRPPSRAPHWSMQKQEYVNILAI